VAATPIRVVRPPGTPSSLSPRSHTDQQTAAARAWEEPEEGAIEADRRRPGGGVVVPIR